MRTKHCWKAPAAPVSVPRSPARQATARPVWACSSKDARPCGRTTPSPTTRSRRDTSLPAKQFPTQTTSRSATNRRADEPSNEEVPMTGFDTRPDYRVDLLARRNDVTASVDGKVIARTTRVLLVDEQ